MIAWRNGSTVSVEACFSSLGLAEGILHGQQTRTGVGTVTKLKRVASAAGDRGGGKWDDGMAGRTFPNIEDPHARRHVLKVYPDAWPNFEKDLLLPFSSRLPENWNRRLKLVYVFFKTA